MTRYLFLLLLIWASSGCYAQGLTISGTILESAHPVDDALIDVYEYNNPIQTLKSDAQGRFTALLIAGREQLLVIYKSGYVLQCYSIYDRQQATASSYPLTICLERDMHSPEGLYFQQPKVRVSNNIVGEGLGLHRFGLTQIKPQRRADSILVLLNRAMANQYILIANMQMNTNPDTKYSRQIVENLQTSIKGYQSQINESKLRYEILTNEEQYHQAKSMTTREEAQLDEIIQAQKALAARLQEMAKSYLTQQQLRLSIAALRELEALGSKDQGAASADSATQALAQQAYWRIKAAAVNERYQAMDANRKFLWYNKHELLMYQEYIELLRYKQLLRDTNKPTTFAEAAITKPKPANISTTVDTIDYLSRLDNTAREELIRQGLEEEARFKNYWETNATRSINGEPVEIKLINIAADTYELQIDRKHNSRYLKNQKPITKITFEFETKRRFVQVLQTIRSIDKWR